MTSPLHASPAAPAPTAATTRITLVVTCLTVLVAQLANALPGALSGTFQATFHTNGSEIIWIASAFMVPVVVFELSFGLLGDRFGHRRLISIGALTLALGSLLCTLAPTVQIMWIGSAINGLGAGAMYPASLALLAVVTPTLAQRAKAIAAWSGCLSAGAVIAPVMAGGLASAGMWQLSYGAVVILGVGIAVFSRLAAAESPRLPARAVDWGGQITLALGLTLILFALIQGPESGWTTPSVWISLLVGLVSLVAFIVIQRRVGNPLLQLELFRNPAFSVASIVAVVGMFAFLGACYCFSMLLGAVQHQDPINIGIVFVMLQGPAFVLIPLVSALMTHVPDRYLLSGGLFILALGAYFGSLIGTDATNLAPYLLPALVIGVGFAFTLSPVTAIAINTVPRQLAGMASATTNLLRDLGFALAPALVGGIAVSTAASHIGSSLAGSGVAPELRQQAEGIFHAGGPYALNSVPPGAPGADAAPIALEGLSSGFSSAFLVCAVAAAAAALLVLVFLRHAREPMPTVPDDGQTSSAAGDATASTESGRDTGRVEPAQPHRETSPEPISGSLTETDNSLTETD